MSSAGARLFVAENGERENFPSFRPGPARHPRTRRMPYPLLPHRRSKTHFTTLPCRFTSTEVVYGVTGTDVTGLPEYGVSP